MLSLSFIKEIEKIIGRENVLTSEADRQNYAYDAAVLPPVVPGLVVRPTRTDQLGPLIQKCYEEGIPITIRGSGTNLSGGTIPDSTDAVIILTNSLDRIMMASVLSGMVPPLRFVPEPRIVMGMPSS